MNTDRFVPRLLAAAQAAAPRLQPFAALVTRLVIGQAFILTGLGKWRNFESTVAFFGDVGIPLPAANAAFIATLEVAGGFALLLGLGTRLVSALLASTMAVALLTADRAAFTAALAPGAERGLTGIAAVTFLMFLLWLVGCGAGPLSLDRVVASRRARVVAASRISANPA